MKDLEGGLSYLLRFLRTFVVHLTAKRALERYYFKTREHEAKISLFAVERTPLVMPVGSWPNLKDILTKSLLPDPSDSESSTSASDADITIKAIKLLEDKIKTPPQKYSPKCRYLLADFERITQNKPILLHGGMHCETVLATLGRYYENCHFEGNNSANLVSTCEVLYFYLLTARSDLLS
jgi:hypothetical protein